MWELTWLIARIEWSGCSGHPDGGVFLFLDLLRYPRDACGALGSWYYSPYHTSGDFDALGQLPVFSWLSGEDASRIPRCIPVLFQPELRRALEQLGTQTRCFLYPPATTRRLTTVIENVVKAVEQMAANNVGALIVFERKTGLQEYIDTGVLYRRRCVVRVVAVDLRSQCGPARWRGHHPSRAADCGGLRYAVDGGFPGRPRAGSSPPCGSWYYGRGRCDSRRRFRRARCDLDHA